MDGLVIEDRGDGRAGYGGLVIEKQKQHKPTFIFLLYFIEILPNV